MSLAWTGFRENQQSLHEHGAQAALPIWMQFMHAALQGHPEHTFLQPPNIVNIKIDPATGKRASANNASAMFEYFMTPYVPGEEKNPTGATDNAAATDNGGGVY